MARYLVVAHQTASSPELLQRLSELRAEDPEAIFTLLVPATPVVHLLVWEEGETREVAEKTAERAAKLFSSRGLNVVRTGIGDSSPLLAIEDEMRSHPGEHDAIVLSTLPVGISRWLRLDVHHQAQQKFDIPVIHVVAQKAPPCPHPASHHVTLHQVPSNLTRVTAVKCSQCGERLRRS